jgi:hypothetical protein
MKSQSTVSMQTSTPTDTMSPGQQLYSWFIADSRPPHTPLPWTHLTRRQQGIFELWAIHRGRWATCTQEPDGTHAT